MKKNKKFIPLVLVVLAMAVFIYSATQGLGPTGTGSAKNIKLGLDLSGGVSITYEAVDGNPSAKDMNDTVSKLQQRVENYSTEASVYKEGSDRIVVEIPDVTDANAILEELGTPGSLEIQNTDGEVLLTGDYIKTAEANTTTNTAGAKQYVVDLTFTEEGTTKFADITTEYLNQQLPIVYDGTVVSSPNVNSTITEGTAEITGMSSYEEAEQLASYVRIGSLSLELKELSSEVLAAQLGNEAISSSLMAGAIGMCLVILLMLFLYRIPGLASSIALVLYVAVTVVTLNAFNVTLTLPGLAGILLSIGMAVDANVIIFARIKEEIGTGKSVKAAIDAGFHKALSAIIDGNVTTLIAALVLQLKGSGTVKGFAQTLAIGVVLSMFTALTITRLILNAFYDLGLQDVKLYGATVYKKTRNFLKHRYLNFGISIAFILVGVAFMVMNQNSTGKLFNYSLEFLGGNSTTVTFDKDYSINEIDTEIIPTIEEAVGEGNIQAQKIADSTQIVFKTRELTLDEREKFNEALSESYGITVDDITVASISSTISGEMRTNAIIAVAISILCMLVYIWFRFKDIRFAASAVIALLNDVLIIIAFYAISGITVGSTFIACLLTIVGYSINATIIIFDRMREHLKTMTSKDSIDDMVNESITQTLSRSIITNLTVFVMITVLYVIGVPSIKEFAAPLMVGVAGGTFSSICITGPLWHLLRTKFTKAENER